MIEEAVNAIKIRLNLRPDIGLILGSGLGGIVDLIKDSIEINFCDIPNFPVSTVSGHAGKLVFGKIEGVTAAVMQGRIHYYEGYNLKKVVFPVYVLNQLGIKNLIITNASGGINNDFKPGDLMIICDHINLLGNNPLIGPEDMGPRFVDMSQAYSPELREIAKSAAQSLNLPLREGVYACLTGPSYETPAEIRMLKTIGADAVGMSTVPEVIIARQCGMKVLAISCITNMAAGIYPHELSHKEVIEVAKKSEEMLAMLLKEIIKRI
ncbi:MAG: purine-nucleoside phosphorylase [Tepidanaerobacteraceae bacterium]|jgi:purine-nucleoside phosphorylase|nr:purine-nucleoside phosphorylase [Tepidanaerobacteraceae bacterium]